MNRVPVGILILVILLALFIGAVGGFFLGVASTKAGAKFLEDLAQTEQQAETRTPQKLVRDRFELSYPGNWKIDVDDADYDPDQMFSIDSPGDTFVMFVMGDMETDPKVALKGQIDAFSELMGAHKMDPFDTFGQYEGKGAILTGKLLGIRVTVKMFCCFSDGMTAMIVQQYPDEDFKYVEKGLSLIEKSFTLKPGKENPAPEKQDE